MSNAILWPKIELTVMSRLKAPEYGPPLHLHGCQRDGVSGHFSHTADNGSGQTSTDVEQETRNAK